MHKNLNFLIVLFLSILFVFSSCSYKTSSKPVIQNSPIISDKSEAGKETKDIDKTENKQEDNKNLDNSSSDKDTNTNKSSTDSNKENSTNNNSSSMPKGETSNKTQSSQSTKAASPDNLKRSWYYKPNSSHTTPEIPQAINDMLKSYSGYYVGDTNSKDIYLTFDEGYENGYSSKILDILKANNVKAAFFVTRPYIMQQKDLIKRMVSEGHVVGNHTSKHPSMPTLTSNAAAFKKEFTDTEDAYKSVTGTEMPKFFRPPMGEYSAKSLAMTKELGYKSIFWSFAHRDWLVDNQPGAAASHDRVINGSHNGAILLLHAVSKSNTEALDSIIKDLKSQGYVFKTLYELK